MSTKFCVAQNFVLPYYAAPVLLAACMNRIAYSERASIPKICAVYIIFSGEVCLYIGSSDNIRKRINTHNRRAEFESHSATHIEWIDCEYSQLGEIENAAIAKRRPILNSYAARSKQRNKKIASATLPSGEFTTFRDYTLKMLHNRKHYITLSSIANETGISANWLSQFSAGSIENPSVNTIERLYAYLKGEPLKVSA